MLLEINQSLTTHLTQNPFVHRTCCDLLQQTARMWRNVFVTDQWCDICEVLHENTGKHMPNDSLLGGARTLWQFDTSVFMESLESELHTCWLLCKKTCVGKKLMRHWIWTKQRPPVAQMIMTFTMRHVWTRKKGKNGGCSSLLRRSWSSTDLFVYAGNINIVVFADEDNVWYCIADYFFLSVLLKWLLT